jgi:Ricin-type beta-trefoil lectin domain
VRGQIKSDLSPPAGGAHLCLELDASNHDYIVMAACKGKASEEWKAEAGHDKGSTVYVNGYKTKLCLNVYPYGDYPQLIGYTCNTKSVNQEFFPYLHPPA